MRRDVSCKKEDYVVKFLMRFEISSKFVFDVSYSDAKSRRFFIRDAPWPFFWIFLIFWSVMRRDVLCSAVTDV